MPRPNVLHGDLTWLCSACGRTEKIRSMFGETTCFENAVAVVASTIQRDAKGRVTKFTKASDLDKVGRRS